MNSTLEADFIEKSDKADDYIQDGMFEEALIVFTEMEQRWPDNSYIPLMRGRCLVQLKKVKEAETSFRRCIEIMPDHPTAQFYIDIIPTGEWSLTSIPPNSDHSG